MKLFVTGATGFIGSHFVNQALDAGHDVVALRRSSDSRPRIALKTEPQWLYKGLNQVGEEDFHGCTTLVHLSAIGVSPQKATWRELMQTNVLDAIYLAERARNAGIQRFVVAGTFAEYGRSGERFDFIPPDAPLEPTFPYAASKAAAFCLFYSFAISSQCELYYGRIFSAYGEGQHESNLWPSLRQAAEIGEDFAMTHGEQIRDFVSVESVADTFLKACQRNDVKCGEPIVENVASGQPRVLREFAEFWWKKWGATGKLKLGEIPYRENEVMRFVPEILK